MQFRRATFAVAVSALLQGGAAAAAPAPVPAATDTDSGDIVVTALKANEPSRRIGMSIQTVTRDELDRVHVATPADLMKLVPGLTVAPATPPIYTMRGVGYYDTSLGAAPAISFSLDQVPLPYPILAPGALLDLDRIEVLKGPQGPALGQNSTGGAINFVAAKPTDRLAAGATAEFGRFSSLDAQAFVSGPLSGHIRARLSVRRQSAAPWQRSYTRNDRLGGADFWSGRLQVEADLGARTLARLTINGFRDRGDDQAGQLIAVSANPAVPAALRDYPRPPADPRAADWTPGIDLRRNHEFVQASLRVEHDFGFAEATSVTAWQHLRRSGALDADATALPTLQVSTSGRLTVMSQEFLLNGTLGGRPGPVRWLAGTVFQHEVIDDGLDVAFPVSSFPFGGANARTRQRVDTAAVFGTVTYALTSRLRLESGLRVTRQRRAYSGCTYDDGSGSGGAFIGFLATLITGSPVVIGPGACGTLGADFRPAVVRGHLDQDNLSWRIGADWSATPDLLVYANASRGYKSGAFPTIGATSYLQYGTVGQESVLAFESGLKLALPSAQLHLTAAVFTYGYTDKQFRGKRIDPILGPLDALVSIPRSSVQGAELQLSWQPTPAFHLGANGSYTRARILGAFRNFDALGNAAELGGKGFPLTPRWQANLVADTRVPLSAGVDADVSGNASYQGRSNSGLGELALFDVPGVIVVDVRTGLSAHDAKWRAGLFVRNLTDRYTWTLVSSGPDATYRLAALPRTYGIDLAWHY